MKKVKLFYIAPHPVTYHTGIYRAIAKLKELEFKVVYEDSMGLKPIYIDEFKSEIEWDVDLLSGYDYEFLKNYTTNPEIGFFSRVNLGLFKKFLISKPDVVLFKGYMTFSDWLVLLLAKLTRTKVIFRGEGTLRRTENIPSLKQKVKYAYLKFWFRKQDLILFSCGGNKEFFKHYGVPESKLFPIHCAVDNDYFQEQKRSLSAHTRNLRDELRIPKEAFVILFSARFTSRKRPLDLISAVGSINHDNIFLLFVGDGPQRKQMEKSCLEKGINCHFAGFVNISEISKYYNIADLDVVISDYDPSPKAMNEAMNFSLPIIVTDIVGTAQDLVAHGENGYIINVGDVAALSEKINYLANNREYCKKMGEISLSKVRDWNFEKNADSVLSAVKKLLTPSQ